MTEPLTEPPAEEGNDQEVGKDVDVEEVKESDLEDVKDDPGED